MSEIIENDQYKYKWWALAGISLLAFTAFLDFTIVNTAIPFIQHALHASVIQLQWIPNIYVIILSILLIAGGKCADLFGRKRVFYIGVIIFALAALAAGFSPNIDVLIFFRGIQGIGGAIIFVAAAALVSQAFPPKQQAHAVGIYSGITGAGLLLGPLVGGVLIQWLDWRWVFWVNIPIVIVGMGLCLFSLKRVIDTRQQVSIDWTGFILLVIGLGSFVYGIVAGAQYGWSSPISWVSLVVGVIGLVVLIVVEDHIAEPLLDLKIFKDNLILMAAISCSLAGIVADVFMFFDPLYLRVLRHLSPLNIGLLIAIIPSAQVIISLLFSKMLKRWGLTTLLFVSVVAAFLAVFFHGFIGLDTPYLFIALPFILLGVNWGLSNTLSMTAVNEVIPGPRVGAVLGTLFSVWNIIGAVFLAGSSALFHLKESSVLEEQVSSQHIVLTEAQKGDIHTLLGDPTEAISALKAFVGTQAEQIWRFFENAFLEGFHAVVLLNGIVMLLALLLSVWICRALSQRKSLDNELDKRGE